MVLWTIRLFTEHIRRCWYVTAVIQMFSCRTDFLSFLKVIAVMMKHVYATTPKLWYTLRNQHNMRKQDILEMVVRNDKLVPSMQ